MRLRGGTVVSLALSVAHEFSKHQTNRLELLAGHGVVGDCHAGKTVQHLSRMKKHPDLPNLRQVHLLPKELLDELGQRGFPIEAGALGENILTEGIELIALPRGTRLVLGPDAVIEVTGLRNPCKQIEAFRPGLLAHVVGKDAEGAIIRRTGVMAVVLESGTIGTGDAIRATLPPEPHQALEVV